MASAIGETVTLARQWHISGLIGHGGLGTVYRAISDLAGTYALKLVEKAPGADRELLFGEDLSQSVNVIPIIDKGEWGNYLVLVMPEAEQSLRSVLNQNGPFDPLDALVVLIDIAEALVSLASSVVHRDIKPDNILYFDGRWHLADFGISKYAGATTAPDTQKFARTPAYAAPEQWRDETATGATDIYALGIVAYELLSGHVPFWSDDVSEIRRQHLHEPHQSIPNIEAPLQSIFTECLIKAPGSRPSAHEVLERLRDASDSASSSATILLRQANAIAVNQRAEAARQESMQQSEESRRDALYGAAIDSFKEITSLLTNEIQRHAVHSRVESLRLNRNWHLNSATLMLQLVQRTTIDGSSDRFSRPPFDIVAHAAIGVKIPRDRWHYEGRSHSLWYCDAQSEGQYRWFETAFMNSAFVAQGTTMRPYDIDPSPDAFRALAPIVDVIRCAWPFTAIDRGEKQVFVDRWLEWFGRAATGQLQAPSTLPEREPSGSWR